MAGAEAPITAPRIRSPAFALALQLLAQFHPALLAVGIVTLTRAGLPGDDHRKRAQQQTESGSGQR